MLLDFRRQMKVTRLSRSDESFRLSKKSIESAVHISGTTIEHGVRRLYAMPYIRKSAARRLSAARIISTNLEVKSPFFRHK